MIFPLGSHAMNHRGRYSKAVCSQQPRDSKAPMHGSRFLIQYICDVERSRNPTYAGKHTFSGKVNAASGFLWSGIKRFDDASVVADSTLLSSSSFGFSSSFGVSVVSFTAGFSSSFLRFVNALAASILTLLLFAAFSFLLCLVLNS